MLKLVVAAAGLWSVAAAVATVPATLQPYGPCGSSACIHRPLTSSSQRAGQHSTCRGASWHDPACPVGYSCQQQGRHAWLCRPAVAKEAGSPAAAQPQAEAQAAADLQRRSLAQIVPDNAAVATRTTDTPVPGSSPTAGGTAAGAADSNPALAPYATSATAPASTTAAGSNSTNPAVATRTTNETVPGASTGSGSGTQASNAGRRQPIPLVNCPAGQMAVASQCVAAGSIGSTRSSAAPRVLCAGLTLQWLASAALLAVLLLVG